MQSCCAFTFPSSTMISKLLPRITYVGVLWDNLNAQNLGASVKSLLGLVCRAFLLSPSYELLIRMSQWKQEFSSLVSSKARKITLIPVDWVSPDGRESAAETTDTLWKPAHPLHLQLSTLSAATSAPQAPKDRKPCSRASSLPGCRSASPTTAQG